ncbi:RimK family alpha-L-glutamate ligase [Gorillibacterium sp. CAU 1737]|uniref:ATP-grasp domain-containing protein n=1 Tax=Gorillibacterium sp. CAU 1737 TaxID=3140362 RepID=UPI0032612F5B
MNRSSCAIVYNGNLGSEKFLIQVRWLERTAREHGLHVQVIGNQELIPGIVDGSPVIKGRYEGQEPDFFLFWDKDIRLARHLEKMGFPLYNRASCIELCDDKIRTYEQLLNEGLRLPKTLIAPLIYETCEGIDERPYETIVQELGFPMVVKEAFGSFGEQVHLVRGWEELLPLVHRLKHRPHLFQELVKSSYGRDIRLQVVGDKVVAAMMRKSEHDFRANVTAGGRMAPYEPSEREREVAVTCARLLGADFAGVDLLFGEDGEPYVCEVNSNAHFKNIHDCTGVDVAARMLEHIMSKER